MAVFKANYVKRNGRERQGAKATLRYIESRPGLDRAQISRTLFDTEGAMSRQDAYRLIDEAQNGSYFYRFIISPDPKQEDTRRDLHMRQITEQTLRRLSELLKQEIVWIAAEHADHAPHRHVHVVAIVKQKLDSLDLKLLRLSATEAALFQRQSLDLALGISQEQTLPAGRQGRALIAPRQARARYPRGAQADYPQRAPTHLQQQMNRERSTEQGGGGGSTPRPETCFCYHCGLSQPKRYLETTPHCIRCGLEIRTEKKITLLSIQPAGRQSQEAEWEL